ncbi:conserved hypothetical protein [Streptomyces misionensis JCM 4497]
MTMVTSPSWHAFASFGGEPDETRRTGMQAKTTHRGETSFVSEVPSWPGFCLSWPVCWRSAGRSA